MGVSLCTKERRPGSQGPRDKQGKKLTVKSDLKTYLHYLEDAFKSACPWVLAGHTPASANTQHYITINFLGDSPCPGFPSRMQKTGLVRFFFFQ